MSLATGTRAAFATSDAFLATYSRPSVERWEVFLVDAVQMRYRNFVGPTEAAGMPVMDWGPVFGGGYVDLPANGIGRWLDYPEIGFARHAGSAVDIVRDGTWERRPLSGDPPEAIGASTLVARFGKTIEGFGETSTDGRRWLAWFELTLTRGGE